MKLTVLICSHNRQPLLQRTVDFLDQAQRPEQVECEILVVANGCTDGSVAWLSERSGQGVVAAGSPAGTATGAADDLQRPGAGPGVGSGQGPLPLRFAEEPRLGKTNALNLAIEMLKGCDPEQHLVAMVDDDHRVDEEYLVGAVRAAREYPDFSMFCGQILPDWDGREPNWVHDDGPYRIYPLPVPRFERGDQPLAMTPDVGVPGGGNLVLRAGVFQRVGGFASDIGPKGHDLAGGEDGEFVLRAQRLGERIQYVPWFIQYHYVELERLQTPYLMRKSYQRTKATMRLSDELHGSGVPKYLWRKLAGYAGSALWSINWARTRFYLVRAAAAWGEVAAFRERQTAERANPVP